jgi:hypothetical protein
MREIIVLAFIPAAVFTAGCTLIKQLEHNAEYLEGALTSAFLIVAALATIAFLERYADGACLHSVLAQASAGLGSIAITAQARADRG